METSMRPVAKATEPCQFLLVSPEDQAPHVPGGIATLHPARGETNDAGSSPASSAPRAKSLSRHS